MQQIKKIYLIEKLLKRKKEVPIIELKITDYNNSNFYLSLLYSQSIKKFKVLYVPLDVVEDTKIEEYFCYQFIGVKSTTYLIEQIKKELPKYKESSTRDKRNKYMANYEIEIDIHDKKEEYDFYATRYLPKEFNFFFETIVMLFEHAPNIMSELATEILSILMNTNEVIEYQASINCDLWKADLEKYFPSTRDESNYLEGKIEFLEYVNGKYYAIIDEHLLVIEYNRNQKILNIYCDDKKLVYSTYTYQVLKAIQNNMEKRFYKIKVTDKNDTYNYLCLGIDKKKLKVIKGNKLKTLALRRFNMHDITILEDDEGKLKEELEEVMVA